MSPDVSKMTALQLLELLYRREWQDNEYTIRLRLNELESDLRRARALFNGLMLERGMKK